MRSIAAFLLLMISATGFAAAPVAPVPAAPPSTAQPAPPSGTFGRLFFTPIERAALDDARRRPTAVAVVPTEKTQEKPPQPPAPEFVTVNGVVRSSDGVTTVWLNNKPVTGARSEQGLIVTPATRAATAGNVTVQVPQTGRRVNLKVGQQLEVNSGKVEESYRVPGALPAAADPPVKSDDPADRTAPRRPSAKQRDLLRDLLREIDGPASEPPQTPGAGKG